MALNSHQLTEACELHALGESPDDIARWLRVTLLEVRNALSRARKAKGLAVGAKPLTRKQEQRKARRMGGKLTPESVLEIRATWAARVTLQSLAEKYKVSPTAIAKIVNRRSHRSL